MAHAVWSLWSSSPIPVESIVMQQPDTLQSRKIDVFLSYAHEDKQTADAIVATLERGGVRCWYAPRDILPGADWPSSIIAAIEGSRGLVVLISKHSVHSSEVEREVGIASSCAEMFRVPFRVADVVLTGNLRYYLHHPHWLDALSPPLERHLANLTSVVKGQLGLMSATIAAPNSAPTDTRASPDPYTQDVTPDQWGQKEQKGLRGFLGRLLSDPDSE